jgi:hypothetical protein
MKPAEFKAFIDEQGLQAIGSHCNPEYTVNITLQDEFKNSAEMPLTWE